MTCVITFCGINIAVTLEGFTDCEYTCRKISEIHESDSLCGTSPVNNIIKGTVSFTHSDFAASVLYDRSTKALRVISDSKKYSEGRAIYYMAEYLASCLLALERGIMMFHSAAVFSPHTQKSYVILGGKGAGKTTLTAYLCRELGMHIIANDRVLAGLEEGKLFTYGGTSWLDVRRTAICASSWLRENMRINMPENDNMPSWNSKERILPAELGIMKHSGRTEIAKIYHIRKDIHQKNIYCEKWQGVQQSLLLHETFGRSITGQTTPFLDDDGNYYGSLPLVEIEALMRARDNFTKYIITAGVREIFASSCCEIAEIMKGDMIPCSQ